MKVTTVPESSGDHKIIICQQHEAILQKTGRRGVVGPDADVAKHSLQAFHNTYQISNRNCISPPMTK